MIYKRNKRLLRTFIMLVVTSVSLQAMKPICLQDVKDAKDGMLSNARFDELKNSPAIGTKWLDMTYHQYKESTRETQSTFADIIQQELNKQNPAPTGTIQVPPTFITHADIQQQNTSSGIRQTVAKFFTSMLPWNGSETLNTPVDTNTDNEIYHDPLIADQGSQKIPGTSISVPIPASIQTVKNKIGHHQAATNIAATALPFITSGVERVGNHIENNKAAFIGGDVIIPVLNVAYNSAYTRTLAKDLLNGKPKTDDDAEYEKIRAAHREKLRPQFRGSDEEFEKFFSSCATPVKNTTPDRHRETSLIDGAVAGLNDITRTIANTARLLNNPDIKNAYAASRRINKELKQPKSLSDAIAILQTIERECTDTITPSQLLGLEEKPDEYLTHLLWTTYNLGKLSENLSITVGNLKEYGHTCLTILDAITHYTGSAQTTLHKDVITFIESLKLIDNRVHAMTLPKSEKTGLSSITTIQGYINQALGLIMQTEKNRPRYFSDALKIVYNHIKKSKDYSLEANLKDFIKYEDSNNLNGLYNTLFKNYITNQELIHLIKQNIVSSISNKKILNTRLDSFRYSELFNKSVLQGYSLNFHQIPALNDRNSEEYRLKKALRNCSQEICNIALQWKTTDEKIQIAEKHLNIIKTFAYTHHENIRLQDLINYSSAHDILRKLERSIKNGTSSPLQVLRDLAGYYVLLIEQLVKPQLSAVERDATPSDIPTAPTPPVLREPHQTVIKKKDARSVIDKGLDKVVDKISDGTDYLIQHGPSLIENTTKRLANANQAMVATGFFAAVQALLTPPVNNQGPIPAAPFPLHEPVRQHNNVSQGNTLSAHNLQEWRKRKGKSPQEEPVSVANPWLGRQEAANDKTDILKNALTHAVEIQQDSPRHWFIREEQFKYNNLKKTPAQQRISPSVWSRIQDKYLEYAIRIGYVGDITLIAGAAWTVYYAYIRSSYYQIRTLERIEKQCKHSMRTLLAAKSSFEVPQLISGDTITRLSRTDIAELNGALARTRNAFKSAQAELNGFTQIPDNYQELATIAEADRAASDVIALIKKYTKKIGESRGLFDTGFSSCALRCAKIAKMITAE